MKRPRCGAGSLAILTIALLGLLAGEAFLGRDDCPAQDDYQAWRARQQQDFAQYVSEQDRQFSSWLEEQWREFDAMQGIVRDTTPKPEDIPAAPVSPDRKPAPVPEPRLEIKPVESPRADPVKPAPRADNRTSVPFFKGSIRCSLVETGGIRLGRTVDEEAISGFWTKMSGLSHDTLLAEAAAERDRRQLNDWGYLLLLHALGRAAFPGDTNLATLATWFYLLKSGYDARIGFWADRVHLMLPTQQTLYSRLNFRIEGRRYYLFALDEKDSLPQKMMIFEGSYPGSEKQVDLRLSQMPDVGSDPFRRSLSFEFAGHTRSLQVDYDQSAIDFLAGYPQTDLDIYFTAPPTGNARATLLQALAPEIKDLPAKQAVDLLLRFVQTGFAYKTDGDQFGREKYMFVEEVIRFPYSDCEDRSVLFHYLVVNLLHLDVVGLSYPGHVATAVEFKQDDVGGDALYFENRKYVICDPTYINAGTGMCMPRFRDVQPQVLCFD